MVILLSNFILSVVAGVVSHYLCKRLDRRSRNKGQ